MANGWTPARRARQARLIKTWRPWEKSTGPRTAAGQAIAARNADKGKAEQRKLGRQAYADAKYCLKQYDLLVRELEKGPSKNKRYMIPLDAGLPHLKRGTEAPRGSIVISEQEIEAWRVYCADLGRSAGKVEEWGKLTAAR
jgi:hypothetical protein